MVTKRQDIRNFYMDEEFLPVWKKFRIICLREETSASEKIRGFIARYVATHDKGNPQMILERYGFTKQGECFKCERLLPKNELTRVEFISGLKAWLCMECLNNELAKGAYCTIKKKVLK